MKPLPQLDLVAGPSRPWAGLGLCVVGGALVAYTALAFWQADARNRDTSAALTAQAARIQPPAARKLTEAERVQIAAVARVASELRAPWSDLLATFEDHGHDDVGLLKLEPDARARTVRITGQARDTQALFTYLRALEADSRLVDVALTTHQAEREIPGKPVRFVIQAGWRSAPAFAGTAS